MSHFEQHHLSGRFGLAWAGPWAPGTRFTPSSVPAVQKQRDIHGQHCARQSRSCAVCGGHQQGPGMPSRAVTLPLGLCGGQAALYPSLWPRLPGTRPLPRDCPRRWITGGWWSGPRGGEGRKGTPRLPKPPLAAAVSSEVGGGGPQSLHVGHTPPGCLVTGK